MTWAGLVMVLEGGTPHGESGGGPCTVTLPQAPQVPQVVESRKPSTLKCTATLEPVTTSPWAGEVISMLA